MTDEHETRLLEVITELPWADFDGAICGMEECLRLALEATRDAFLNWDLVARVNDFADEFSLSLGDVEDLLPEERLAYVARLLRSLALNYGVSTEFGKGPLVGEADAYTPAGILRGLNDISWTPMTTERASLASRVGNRHLLMRRVRDVRVSASIRLWSSRARSRWPRRSCS
jgi:hypothetical protein